MSARITLLAFKNDRCGYYIAKTKEPEYWSYAVVTLPYYKPTSYNLVRKEKTKGLIMELLGEMKKDSTRWYLRIVPALHKKLEKIVYNYSDSVMDNILEMDKTGSIFDNDRVDLQRVFYILLSISKDKELNEDEIILSPVSLRRSSSVTNGQIEKFINSISQDDDGDDDEDESQDYYEINWDENPFTV